MSLLTIVNPGRNWSRSVAPSLGQPTAEDWSMGYRQAVEDQQRDALAPRQMR